MIHITCNRCGIEITSNNSGWWHEIFKRYRIMWKGRSENEIHLCRDCEKDFEAFLKEKKNDLRK